MSESSQQDTTRWRRLVLGIAWAWTLAVFVLLWMPPPPPPEIVWWWWDKLVHLGLMTAFAGLWTWAGVRGARLVPLGVLVGAATEMGQGLLPWRHASWDDFGFDVLGVVLGWLLARWLWPSGLGARPRWW